MRYRLIASGFVNPKAVLTSLTQQWTLVLALSRRWILTRYRGSFLGIVWSMVTPLIRLAIYTFVFGTIFRARWHDPLGHTVDFSAILSWATLPDYRLFQPMPAPSLQQPYQPLEL